MDKAEQKAAEDALILMSRAIRDKLDLVRIKLHLAEWQQLPMSEREYLRDAPCQSADEVERFRSKLTSLVQEHCGKLPDQMS